MWSFEDASGTILSPETKQIKLASSPFKNSSITITELLIPLAFPVNKSLISLRAVSSSSTIKTPLPAASPSAFITIGIFCFFMYFDAEIESVKVSCFAVKTFPEFKISLQKLFEPSNCEAALQGPNIFKLFFLNSSTIPSTSGASGPTMVRSIFLLFANPI